MGDLDDQLRRLADQRASQTPETFATTAMATASSGGRTSPAWWLAGAAMLAILAGAGAWLIGDQEDAAVNFGVAIEAPAEWEEI
jgi:hypothetical protein